MAKSNKSASEITTVADTDLLPEFKKHYKPFGFEQYQLNWILVGVLPHASFLYYFLYLFPNGHIPKWSYPLGVFYAIITGFGAAVGCHRYWSHRSFKAKMPLQILLMLLQTGTVQFPIFLWCQDHRAHHKYNGTDGDPVNASRGFWYSHIGWLFQPRHPTHLENVKKVEVSDLANDPVVRFQSKYYWQLVSIMFLLVPMTLCHLVFPEMSLFHLFIWNFTWFFTQLHVTFCVNSVAHIWGDRPYDKFISARHQGWLSLIAIGEGWHNYHHTFPWDYKAAELGWKYNLSTIFIDFFAWIGWAHDLKTVSHKLLLDRINRTGDGTHPMHNSSKRAEKQKVRDDDDNCNWTRTCWGWGDEKISKEEHEVTKILFPSPNE